MQMLQIFFQLCVFYMTIFLFLNKFLCCDNSLESSRRDDSNEWPQQRIWLRLKETSQKMLLNCNPSIIVALYNYVRGNYITIH